MKDKILKWAQDRDLLKPENKQKQFIKLIEEVGELAQGIAKNDLEQIVDSIGDVQVVLIILSALYELDSEECLQKAYEVIKNRTGQTIDGIFIKNE
jgi:NTP pyrophosphatase (non-canonical NTP hydrolase)